MILLSPEQIRAILKASREDPLNHDTVSDLLLAQAKAIYEWGNEGCPHRNRNRGFLKRECSLCWKGLKDEIEAAEKPVCNDTGKQPEANERIYPCIDCGKLRSKDEGGTTFTVCDECWEKRYSKSKSSNPEAKPQMRCPKWETCRDVGTNKHCLPHEKTESCDKGSHCPACVPMVEK